MDPVVAVVPAGVVVVVDVGAGIWKRMVVVTGGVGEPGGAWTDTVRVSMAPRRGASGPSVTAATAPAERRSGRRTEGAPAAERGGGERGRDGEAVLVAIAEVADHGGDDEIRAGREELDGRAGAGRAHGGGGRADRDDLEAVEGSQAYPAVESPHPHLERGRRVGPGVGHPDRSGRRTDRGRQVGGKQAVRLVGDL